MYTYMYLFVSIGTMCMQVPVEAVKSGSKPLELMLKWVVSFSV